jgi:hypothetical protein
MTTIRSTLTLALAAFTLSCGGAPPTTTPLTPTTNKVDVAIASVTLADDCGTGPTAYPPSPPSPLMQQPADSPRESMSMSMGDRACEQSSIQLRVANGTAAPATITVKKVELLDETGTVLGELQYREPSQWADDGYQTWDQQVAPDQMLQVSYALSQPAVMAGGTYTVRVTIAAGDGDQTLEQKTTLEAEASLPPGAVT